MVQLSAIGAALVCWSACICSTLCGSETWIGVTNSSMILAAVSVFLIERQFLKAAVWTAVASLLSYFGVIHAYVLTAAGVQNRFGFGA